MQWYYRSDAVMVAIYGNVPPRQSEFIYNYNKPHSYRPDLHATKSNFKCKTSITMMKSKDFSSIILV